MSNIYQIMKGKKIALIITATLLLALGFVAYKFIGPATNKPNDGYLYIKTGSNVEDIKNTIVAQNILPELRYFNLVSNALNFTKVKPGKYKVTDGMSVLNLVRMLRNGQQTPVSFVVTKLRTNENLSAKVGKAFECDSSEFYQFITNNDSLKIYDLDSNTAIAAVLPLTYESKWTSTPRTIFNKFYDAYKKFWTSEKIAKATAQGLTPMQVMIMASIIDEETNHTAEKPTIASVYLNRLQKGMPLQADPTVKFALNDFSIKRVLLKHLEVNSPYNTYRNRGLPPGPICTPMVETIHAVLNAPKTDYVYFVASKNFDGTHIFTNNYQQHTQYAKEYQAALNQFMQNKTAQ